MMMTRINTIGMAAKWLAVCWLVTSGGCSTSHETPSRSNAAVPSQTNEAPSADQPTLVAASPTNTTSSHSKEHTTFYRGTPGPATMPKVMLSKREESLCKVKVGDALPELQLPELQSREAKKLADLRGKKATVVIFWKSDRHMAREQLADVASDVIVPFGKEGVEVVGIAVEEQSGNAQGALRNAEAKFTNLLDADGKAFSQVGSERLPRTYVLDSHGKVAWFDIEYSLATRRELHDALRSITGSK